jgi:hypothetical protein
MDIKSVNNLLDFLEKTFNGGSDFNAPVQRCLDRLTDAKWANSDILLVRVWVWVGVGVGVWGGRGGTRGGGRGCTGRATQQLYTEWGPWTGLCCVCWRAMLYQLVGLHTVLRLFPKACQ